MFRVGRPYSKKDIYRILQVHPEKQRGAWDKGLRYYEGDVFIFSNVGIPGRTGHDYNNFWDGDLFHWEGQTNSNLNHPSIRRLIQPSDERKIQLFTRTRDKTPFIYEGLIRPLKYFDTTPVKIIWQFEKNPYEQFEGEQPIAAEKAELYEGSFRSVQVNKYERNPSARRMCIEHYGCYCNVCDFDFYITYGELGEGYIHVHHITPISEANSKYQVNPITDLIPLCPNCHSMVHKRKKPISPEELKQIILKNQEHSGLTHFV